MKKLIATFAVTAGAVVALSLYTQQTPPDSPAQDQPVVNTPVEPDLQSNVDLQRECATMFREIISIQDTREAQRKEFEVLYLENDRQIAKPTFEAGRTAWLKSENELATDAAALYQESRGKGCFQRVEQRETP